jgi:hypothetical protein
MTKKEMAEINKRLDVKEKTGELLVHKKMKSSMNVQQKFRFNMCLKIMRYLLPLGSSERVFKGIDKEEIRRIMHKHYDYFTTDRLLEIMNIVLTGTGHENEILAIKNT